MEQGMPITVMDRKGALAAELAPHSSSTSPGDLQQVPWQTCLDPSSSQSIVSSAAGLKLKDVRKCRASLGPESREIHLPQQQNSESRRQTGQGWGAEALLARCSESHKGESGMEKQEQTGTEGMCF